MKKVVIILLYVLALVFNLRTTGQTDLFYKGSQISYAKIDDEFIAISQQPVTNREYIIYLMWLRNTFRGEQLEIFYNSFPGLNVDSLKAHVVSKYKDKPKWEPYISMNTVIKYSKPFVKDYMFNPKYLDYPVVGVSWKNANNYGKWLSDRFNEVTLIKKGYLFYVPNPTDQDYFNTEDYIAGMWQGQIKAKVPSTDGEGGNIRSYTWKDYVFVPAFRLPSKEEIIEAKTSNLNISEGNPFLFSKKHFLYKWHKQFLRSENDSSYILSECFDCEGFDRDTIVLHKDFKLQITGELLLNFNSAQKTKTIKEIYIENGQVRYTEEEYRNMRQNLYTMQERETMKVKPCLILTEDQNNNAVLVSEYENILPPDYINFKCFRVSCSMGKKHYAKIVEK